ERYDRSARTIRRWIKLGGLVARKEGPIGCDGRWVLKIWIRVGDLDKMFGSRDREGHVRKIRATAQPFTDGQRAALRKVFLEYLLEREEKRKRVKAGGATAS
ncbi:hypothetical protein, partial [Neisseria gonorrhoeae]|uniref:hypothetical protein n=1 Tax=Neisseria gonorrhoeae TaxID=485 RepID=UPI00311E919C